MDVGVDVPVPLGPALLALPRPRGAPARPGAAAAPVLTDDEQGSILGLRWWTAQELESTDARFFRRAVPALLPRLLAGERVDEPFDTWD